MKFKIWPGVITSLSGGVQINKYYTIIVSLQKEERIVRVKSLVKIMNDKIISVELETYFLNRKYFDKLQEVELSKQQLVDIIFTGNIGKYYKRNSK